MKCANHPDRSALGYCGRCGKPLCKTCLVRLRTGNYCETCAANPEDRSAPPRPRRRIPLWMLVLVVVAALVLVRVFVR